tara:strand:+ start:505 stop:1548 length:1044 start_codon:yes stop_codon:yes gene_type:complete
MKIKNLSIGREFAPKIIAEMSGNHKQSLKRALKLVDIAADCGAHFLKLQTFKAETMTLKMKTGKFVIKNKKSLWQNNTLFNLYKKSAMPWAWHKPIIDRCKKKGIICFSTPFDEDSVDFLEKFKIPLYKVASFEITHLPLIEKIAKTKKPIIISTGMATKKEISEAIQTVRKYNNKKIILMKCTSEYPADPKYSNLKTIVDMRKSFKCEIGLSDHTIGIGCAISSINHGASVIEKHFTINKKDGGIDSPFSLEPFELKMLVSESKRAWLSNGKVSYGPSKNEKKSLVFRRSIFLNKDFTKGDILKLKDISILRPKIGLEPKMSKKILGKKAQKNLKKNTPIQIGMFK